MDWTEISAILDAIILVVLICWMTMDRFNFYFKEKS
jgi:hypothetical protein